MDIRETEYNYFTSVIYDLFEHEYLEKGKKTRSKKHKIFKWRDEPDTPSEECYHIISNRIEYLRTTTPEFNHIFDFCTFIRTVEKVFFYKNKPESIVSCDTEMTSKNKRTLYINRDEVTIKLDLKRDMGDEYINLYVYRNYGKKLVNQFKIKNRETVYNDTDDLMLINVVNLTIQNIMADTLKQYADAIWNHKIIDIEKYQLFNPKINKQKGDKK